MTIPTLVLKLIFAVTASGFALLVGAVLGATVFRSQGGHGLGGLVNLFAGAIIGLMAGIVAAVVLILKFKSNRSALTAATTISTAGAVLTFILIQILDSYDKW